MDRGGPYAQLVLFLATGASFGRVIRVEYQVPVKGKGKHTMKCVNWLREFKDEKELANGFRSMASVVTPDIAAKYQNTLDFYRHVYKR